MFGCVCRRNLTETRRLQCTTQTTRCTTTGSRSLSSATCVPVRESSSDTQSSARSGPRGESRALEQCNAWREHSYTVLSVNCILFFNSFSFRMLSPASYKSLLFVFLWLMRRVLECNLICGLKELYVI